MAEIYACPFCRQLFAQTEAHQCPDCGLALRPLHELPPSLDAEQIEPPAPVPVEYELRPWSYLGRGRGWLLAASVAGIALLFTPWLREQAPSSRHWSGYEFARELPWLWAIPVAWFILFALVLSRRTVYHMRGARLAVGLLAMMALATSLLRIALRPESGPYLTRSYEWGWGLYASAVLALGTMGLAFRFGGKAADVAPAQRS
jgi:hypothetical protein